MAKGIYLDKGKFSRNVAKLRASLNEEYQDQKQSVRVATKNGARDAAKKLGQLSWPARVQWLYAKGAMITDVRKVYATHGDVYRDIKARAGEVIAKRFYYAAKAGRFQEAKSLMDRYSSTFRGVPMGQLNESLHDSSRNTRGRVTLTKPCQIVPDGDLDKYMPKAIKRIGKTASGWNACAERLGEPQIPGFKGTAIHGTSTSGVDHGETKTMVGYILRNTHKQARFRLTRSKIRAAMNTAAKTMIGVVAKKNSRKKRI